MSQQPALAPCEYKTGKTLGQGSYATVKEAVHVKTGQKYAVKVISKSLMAGKEFMILNEIEILKKVSKGHKNIVTLWDYFETPNNLYLVMDLCTGGELFDQICEKGSFFEEDAAKIVGIVVDAVDYLHDQNIVHRDIKPENMLFKTKNCIEELLIADLGLGKIIDEQKMDILMTTCGTPGYMAPEVLTKKGHGKQVDMWSIGVLTYFLLGGYTPFDCQNITDELQRILKADFSFEPEEYWVDVSDTAKDFIRKLLVVDPAKRLTAKEAKKHPWLAQQEFSGKVDLLKKAKFNARSTFKKAIDVVKAVNKMQIRPNSPKEAYKSKVKAEHPEFQPKEDVTVDGQLMVLPKKTPAPAK